MSNKPKCKKNTLNLHSYTSYKHSLVTQTMSWTNSRVYIGWIQFSDAGSDVHHLFGGDIIIFCVVIVLCECLKYLIM